MFAIHRVHSFLIFSFLLLFSTNAILAKPIAVCGDGKCRGGETAESCPLDCSSGSYCGDGTCDVDETNDSCSEDCPVMPPPICVVNGVCNEGEDCLSCPQDCAGVTTGKPSSRYCCGAEGNCYIDDPLLCRSDCGTPISDPFCGDGITNLGEQCDDGGESSLCDSDCTYSVCGDLKVNTTAGEACDAGGDTASCDSDCTAVACGDSHLNSSAGEECDDGNTDSGDGCSAACKIELPPEPYCGDGNLDLDLGEECDDANTISGDGCAADCTLETPIAQVPINQFNIGDSIGEGEAANGTIGDPNHQTVWSTGFDTGDSVNSLNERFENANTNVYYENNAQRDQVFNHAVSGAVMGDFVVQAEDIVAAAQTSTPSGEAGMVSILLGNNDVCASSLDSMTDPGIFEAHYRAGLNELANSEATRFSNIHVSSIPAVYWLWEAKRSDFWCRVFVWPLVPCDNLLDSPADDCASTESRLDPDNDYAGDGDNCIRRKTFHRKIRDIYNPILSGVLQEYIDDGRLPNARYSDVFNVRFEGNHVNGGDCFHPSEAGHALLSEKEWCESVWGKSDPLCTP